ncbi:MAG: putative sugar nucleotidyl transferase [Candidatus Buchananbacteria bacterium]
MKIILFEDNQVKNLYPITLTRPSFGILCGGITLFDLVKKEFPDSQIGLIVRDYLIQSVEQKYKPTNQTDNKILFLNARIVPSFEVIKKLSKKLIGKSQVIKHQKQIIGAYLDLKELGLAAAKIDQLKQADVEKFLAGLKLKNIEIDLPIFDQPWQVVTYNEEILNANLNELKNDYYEKQPGVFVGKNVKLPKEIVLNSSHGLIVIGSNTEVLPFCHLVGPLYLGNNCLVREFTVLKYSCCFGDVCKVAGEIEASVMQGFTNKNHYGFLGYSYLGEWVNLGAGTVTSNLKNNYSSIRMSGVDTSCQFLGSIFGDYSRTAVNSTIYTGKVIGVNCHLYGTITTDVPSFTNYAKDFNCVVEFSLDKSIDLQKIVFARRGKSQTKTDIDLLKKVFELTTTDRKLNKIKKGKILFR